MFVPILKKDRRGKLWSVNSNRYRVAYYWKDLFKKEIMRLRKCVLDILAKMVAYQIVWNFVELWHGAFLGRVDEDTCN